MNGPKYEELSMQLQTIALRILRGTTTGLDAEAVALASVVVSALGHEAAARVAPEPEPAPEPAKRSKGKRAPKGQGAHRHKFNAHGLCDLKGPDGTWCGATRQRAPKGSRAPAADAPPVNNSGVLPATGLPADYRAPVPTAVDDGEDRFSGGAFGTSSATDARRR